MRMHARDRQTLFSTQDNTLPKTKLSRTIVITWMGTVLILVASYTAQVDEGVGGLLCAGCAVGGDSQVRDGMSANDGSRVYNQTPGLPTATPPGHRGVIVLVAWRKIESGLPADPTACCDVAHW